VVPGVLFISRDRYDEQLRKYGEQDFLRVTPEFVIEILSEDDKYTQVNKKVALYLRYGTQLVWVIDPQQRNARVITPEQPAGVIVGEEATLSGEPVLPGWSIRLKELLGAQG
jgi:Uma2 family endonuclease